MKKEKTIGLLFILLILSVFLNFLFMYKINNFTSEVYSVGYYESPSMNISLNVYKDDLVELKLGNEIINSKLTKIDQNIYHFNNNDVPGLLIFNEKSVKIYDFSDGDLVVIPKVLNDNVKKST